MTPQAQTQETNAEDVEEWGCPYCNYTNEKERGVRSHINAQSDDPHQGKSGWDTILKGYNADGELIVGGEGVNGDDYTKKQRIINAWLADSDADNQTTADVTGASEGYASSIKRKLDQGEIEEEAIEEARDDKLVQQYREEFAEEEVSEEDEAESLDGTETSASDETTESGGGDTEPIEDDQSTQQTSEEIPDSLSDDDRFRVDRLAELDDVEETEARELIQSTTHTGEVSAAEIERVRDMLAMILREATFEVENAETTEDKRVAQGKYFVSHTAVEMLDAVLGGSKQGDTDEQDTQAVSAN